MTTSRARIEATRLARLHNAFERVCARHKAGATFSSELHRLRGRRQRGPFRRYAMSTLWALFARWRRDPRPQTLARRYKPGKRPVPTDLINQALDLLAAEPTCSVRKAHAAVMRSVAAQRRISYSSLCRYVRSRVPGGWTAQRLRRLAAVRELAELDEGLKRFAR